MKYFSRTLGVLALALTAVAANAAVSYNVLTATITYHYFGNPLNDVTLNLNTIIFDDKIDFTPGGSVPNGNFSGATIDILYIATSTKPVDSVSLFFSGQVQRWGHIGFSEIITENPGSGVLGGGSGSFNGDSISGGSDHSFFYPVDKPDSWSNQDAYDGVFHFTNPVLEYKVKKTFNLNLFTGTQEEMFQSIASIGIIEQDPNAPVPEPASMAALAVGAIGLIARRRRNK